MSRSGPVTKDTSTVALGLAQIRIGNSATNIGLIAPVLTAADSIGAANSTKFTGNVDFWKLESGFPLLEDLTIPIRETAMLECEFKEISSKNLALARGIDPTGNVSATVVGGTISSTAGTVDAAKSIAVTDTAGPISDTFVVAFSGATAGIIVSTATGEIHDFASLSAAMEPDNGGEPYFSIPANFFTGTWADGDTYSFSTTAYVAGGDAYDDNHAGDIKLGQMVAPDYIRMEAVYTYPNGTNHFYIIFPRANVTSSVELDLQAEDNANVPITIEAKRADSEVSGGHAVWDAMTLGRILFD